MFVVNGTDNEGVVLDEGVKGRLVVGKRVDTTGLDLFLDKFGTDEIDAFEPESESSSSLSKKWMNSYQTSEMKKF